MEGTKPSVKKLFVQGLRFFFSFLMRRHWSNQAVLNWWSQLLCSVYLSDCNFKSPQSELQHTQCIHCTMIKHRNNAEIVQGIQKHSMVLLLQISAQLSSWYWEGAYTSPTRETVYLWVAAPAWQLRNSEHQYWKCSCFHKALESSS